MWTEYVEEADRYNIEAAAEDLENLDGELYDSFRSSAIEITRTMDSESLKELQIDARKGKDYDREVEKLVNPVLRERWLDEKFG